MKKQKDFNIIGFFKIRDILFGKNIAINDV